MENEEIYNEIPKEKDENSSTEIKVREISGKRIYKTGEVAKMLGETPAMIGYYCRTFEEHLNLEHTPGQHRTFNEHHIEILKYILYLIRDEKMSVEQVNAFLSTPQGKLLTPIKDEEDKVKVFVDIISKELKASIEQIVKTQVESSLREVMPSLVESSMDKLSSSLIEQQMAIEGTIKELVTESTSSLTEMNSKINESVDNIGKATNQLTSVEQSLLKWREEKSKEEQEEKKGLFAKLFKK